MTGMNNWEYPNGSVAKARQGRFLFLSNEIVVSKRTISAQWWALMYAYLTLFCLQKARACLAHTLLEGRASTCRNVSSLEVNSVQCSDFFILGMSILILSS